MITHREPDIRKCEVKCALGNIITNKASGSDGIPVELIKILRDDAVTVAVNMSVNLENSAVATGLEKVSSHFQSQRKAMPKKVQSYDAEAEAEAPILWPPDAISRLIGKDLMLGKSEGERRRGQQRMR